EQDQLARPAVRILQVDDEAVLHLGQLFDHRVELARAQADAATVQGRIRAAGDDAGPGFGEPHPVALAPDAWVHAEVRVAVALVAWVVPEAHGHRRHRAADHQLPELAGDLAALDVERRGVDPQPASRHLAAVHGLQRAAG